MMPAVMVITKTKVGGGRIRYSLNNHGCRYVYTSPYFNVSLFNRIEYIVLNYLKKESYSIPNNEPTTRRWCDGEC